jgi:hypothetical protein
VKEENNGWRKDRRMEEMKEEVKERKEGRN